MTRETIVDLAEGAYQDTVDWYVAPPRSYDRQVIGLILRELLIRFYDRLDEEERLLDAIRSEGPAR